MSFSAGFDTRRFLNRITLESEPDMTNGHLMLINEDLKPVEPSRRQWGPWNFVGFWIADSFNINSWMISSSLMIDGMSWWQAWLCVWIGYSFAGAFVCATGRIGATYHIGFPVASRASFGIWGALWPVFNRAAMSCVWYGVQAWIGGECVTLMISSIWPSYTRESKGLPAGTIVNAHEIASFFLFWLISLPAIYPPVHQIRHLFTVKAIVVPTAGVAFFIWSLVRAKGVGPILSQPSTISGSDLGWAMLKGIMSCIANFATLIVNDPDFSRFAAKPKDALWPQLLTIPIGFAITSFIGIMVSSSSTVVFGQPIWNPLVLLESFLSEGTFGNRAGVFMIASAFCLAQLGTNIAANSISAGTDMAALMPRYINIRRGGYLCAIIGLAICPWNLVSSANRFITYLSAYSVFLSSIAGVICVDYYVVRRGYLQVKDLYSARDTSPYFYTMGINWRGYAAYICGILINIVGFISALYNPTKADFISVVASYIYNFNFFCGFIVAAGTYYVFHRISPVPAVSTQGWMEVGDQVFDPSREYAADDGSDYDMQSRTPSITKRGNGIAEMGKKAVNLAGEALGSLWYIIRRLTSGEYRYRRINTH